MNRQYLLWLDIDSKHKRRIFARSSIARHTSKGSKGKFTSIFILLRVQLIIFVSQCLSYVKYFTKQVPTTYTQQRIRIVHYYFIYNCRLHNKITKKKTTFILRHLYLSRTTIYHPKNAERNNVVQRAGIQACGYLQSFSDTKLDGSSNAPSTYVMSRYHQSRPSNDLSIRSILYF